MRPLCRFHWILGSKQNKWQDQSTKVTLYKKAFFQFLITDILKKKKRIPIHCFVFCFFILNRTKCRSVYLGCIHLQQLVHEAGCSHKAGTRSFLAAPSLRSRSSGQSHQGAIFQPSTTDNCLTNSKKPLLRMTRMSSAHVAGPNFVFAHLHLSMCESDDINKNGGLPPLLQVNRGAWARNPECIVVLSWYARKSAHIGHCRGGITFHYIIITSKDINVCGWNIVI